MPFSSFSVVKFANIPIKIKKPVFVWFLFLKGEPQLARMVARLVDATVVPKKTLSVAVKTLNFDPKKNIQKKPKRKVLKHGMDVVGNA